MEEKHGNTGGYEVPDFARRNVVGISQMKEKHTNKEYTKMELMKTIMELTKLFDERYGKKKDKKQLRIDDNVDLVRQAQHTYLKELNKYT